ncbi:Probable pectinesterase 15 [Linum grandiflorum]
MKLMNQTPTFWLFASSSFIALISLLFLIPPPLDHLPSSLSTFPDGFLQFDSFPLISKHHHHHKRRPKVKCEETKWRSKLIYLYQVSLVLTVGQKGCANFTSVQKAVDASPDFGSNTTLILIDSGTYREKVVVNANKTNLVLEGQNYLNTAIEWNDTANSTGGTIYSASVVVFAPSFTAYNISFKVKRIQLRRLLQGRWELRRWRFGWPGTKLLSTDVGFMELKIHYMMTMGGITTEGVSFKDLLISSLGMPSHYLRAAQSTPLQPHQHQIQESPAQSQLRRDNPPVKTPAFRSSIQR